MNKFIDFIRRPNIWICISIIYIWFYMTAKVVASLAPPYLIAKIADSDNSLSVVELKKALLIYIQEGAQEAGISSQYFLYSIAANIIILMPILIIGFFIFKKKSWARNALLAMLVLLIIMPILLSGLASELSLNILNADTMIYLAIIYLFTRRQAKDYFIENGT